MSHASDEIYLERIASSPLVFVQKSIRGTIICTPQKGRRRELRASPPARTFNSVGRLRHAVGREDYLRPAKEAFVATVASRAVELVRRRGLQGVVLAAPPQLIGPLRRRFRDGRVALVARTIGKDLTREPDHALDTWFERLGRGRLLGPLTGYSS
jgi:protein required for attachment to host cells